MNSGDALFRVQAPMTRNAAILWQIGTSPLSRSTATTNGRVQVDSVRYPQEQATTTFVMPAANRQGQAGTSAAVAEALPLSEWLMRGVMELPVAFELGCLPCPFHHQHHSPHLSTATARAQRLLAINLISTAPRIHCPIYRPNLRLFPKLANCVITTCVDPRSSILDSRLSPVPCATRRTPSDCTRTPDFHGRRSGSPTPATRCA